LQHITKITSQIERVLSCDDLDAKYESKDTKSVGIFGLWDKVSLSPFSINQKEVL